MKTNLRKYLCLALLVIIFNPAFSQREYYPAYIINRQADTIYGVGSLGRAQLILHFKAEGSGTVKQLKANEVREFIITDGSHYITRDIVEPDGAIQWYFLEKLIIGKVNLYSIRKGTRFFIEKDDSGMVELISDQIERVYSGNQTRLVRDRTYTGYLRAFMGDVPEIFPRIDQIKTLNRDIMVNLTRDYNILAEADNMIDYTFKIPPKEVKLKVEVVSGINRHNAYYSPFAGAIIHASRPRVSEHFFLRIGYLYSDRPHHRKAREWNKSLRVWQVANKDPDPGIKLAISMQYIFGNRMIKPTLSYGWPTGISLLSSVQGGFVITVSQRSEIHISGSVEAPYRYFRGHHTEYFDNNLAHSFSFGWAYRIK